MSEKRYYEDYGEYDDYVSYGLCDGCACCDENNCSHYKMPLNVIGGRKKKCKGYWPYNKCRCGTYFTYLGDSRYCLNCARGLNCAKDSLGHKKQILQDMNWRLENPNRVYQYSTKHPSFRIELRKLQTIYLRNKEEAR